MKTKKTLITLSLLIALLLGVAFNVKAQQKVNVKTLFWMLPVDIFPEYIPRHDKEATESFIAECDYRNGYLSLGGGQFDWEMCYWNLKDGRKLVAVNNETEEGSIIRTFFYNKDKLTEDVNYKLGGEQVYKLEDFVDVSQLTPDMLKKARESFEKEKCIFFYQLPQKGTSLRVLVDNFSLTGDYDGIPYEANKYVEINWVNETWVKGRSRIFETLYE